MSIFSKTLLSLSITIACCGMTPLALAQQNTTDSVDRPEEMTVTGSRIKCQGDNPSPVQELNLEALNQTGAVSLGDVLQELPCGCQPRW